MALSPAFQVSQSAAVPTTVIFTDTSTGSDPAIASRRIYVSDSSGNYLVPAGTNTNYIPWPLPTNPITVTGLLTQDTAANISVQWLDSGGNVLYELGNFYPLCEQGKQFFTYLISNLSQNPGQIQDISYYTNVCKFYSFLVGGINAVQIGLDLASAQNCFNQEIQMQNNETFYF